MQESHFKGDHAELLVASKAMEFGYIVNFPFGHDARYDLLLEKNGSFKRIQVKTTVSKEDIMVIRTCSVGRTNKKHTLKKYKQEEIEAIIVYDIRTKDYYYIHSLELGEGKAAFQLRFKAPRNGQQKKIRWAKDYLWSEYE